MNRNEEWAQVAVDHAAVGPRDVTRLLQAWGDGDAQAAADLTDLVYLQIRAIAGKHLRGYAGQLTLQPTELAHEMFVRLLEADVRWRDRRHFYGVVGAALRNILIDTARARGSEKRGGGQVHVTLSGAEDAPAESHDAAAIGEALDALRALDPRKHEIVELHYLIGLNREEIARVTELSVPTVDRDLRFARAWLRDFLK